jgi:hypothetical protein
MSGGVFAALFAILIPLGVTLALECAVAGLFDLGQETMRGVVAINLVTNPLVNIFFLVCFGLGFGITDPRGPSDVAVAVWFWAAFFVLEALVVVAEWRALIWVTPRWDATSRRLLGLSATVNVLSGSVGTFVLAVLL